MSSLQTSPRVALRAVVGELDRAVDTQRIRDAGLVDLEPSFWLDSSLAAPGLSRYSFLGDSQGPLAELLTYRIAEGAVTVQRGEQISKAEGDAFTVLEERLRGRTLVGRRPPFPLCGGYVGYFGYEMKRHCGAGGHRESDAPDAAWLFAERLVAVDHQASRTYALALYDERDATERDARRWVGKTMAALERLPSGPAESPEPVTEGIVPSLEPYLSRNAGQ